MNGTAEIHARVSRALDDRRRALAEIVTARRQDRRSGLFDLHGNRGRADCLQDAEHHLAYLSDALATGSPPLFLDYVIWARAMLAARGIAEDDLVSHLEIVGETLLEHLPDGLGPAACEYLEAGLCHLRRVPLDPGSQESGPRPLEDLFQAYLAALLRGERHVASRLALQAVADGITVPELYLHVFQRSQHEIGRLWQANRLSVAQEHYCTAATQLIMSQLYPHVFGPRRNGRSMVATCVTGDLHEIGVRMVSDFFQMEGWDTFYLGANVPASSLLGALAERDADLLAVSATMTAHVRPVAELIGAVRAHMDGRVKVLVGGYPFNVDPDLWQKVGADGSARDAEEAVALAERLVSGRAQGSRRAAPEASGWPGPRASGTLFDGDLYDDLSRLNNELATTQRSLAKTNAELARLNRQKDQFLGMAAHDLRNPLEVILTYSEFLMEEAAPGLAPGPVSFIETIRGSSELMLRLVEDLLDLAKIEAGRLDLDLERVDLAALLAANVARNRVLAARKGVEIRLQPGPERLDMVIDPVKIEQVLNNLIGNAVKFSHPGSAVEVRIDTTDNGAAIVVADFGPGLPADELDRLFRPFERARVRSTAGERGAGLGLAIVHSIVEGHRGILEATNRGPESGGPGAVFRVFLPKEGLEGAWQES